MQTFLPYPSFAETARALDDRRLGKQRVEVLQIFRALTRERYGWRSHPAVRMWRGYQEALIAYGFAICDEWQRRGHRDTVRETLRTEWGGTPRSEAQLLAAGALPPWLGRDDVHLSHRCALVRKAPDFYRPLFGDVPAEMTYVWPVDDPQKRPDTASPDPFRSTSQESNARRSRG